MTINKKAGYVSAMALPLALVPLFLAVPAMAEPCGTIGGVIPVLICPPAPTRSAASPTPSPTASSTAAPAAATPVLPPAQPPATPPTTPAPAAGQQTDKAPAADIGAVLPPAAPATPALPTATPTENPGAAVAPKTSEEEDGRGVPGALLLALGGLLTSVWAAISLRRPA